MRIYRNGFSYDKDELESHTNEMIARCSMAWICPGCRIEDHAKHEQVYKTTSGLTASCQCVMCLPRSTTKIETPGRILKEKTMAKVKKAVAVPVVEVPVASPTPIAEAAVPQTIVKAKIAGGKLKFANGIEEKAYESSVGLTVSQVKRWPNQKLLAILASEGISLPLETEESDLQRAVSSFVQIAWYEAFGTTDPKVPERIRMAHEARIKSYLKGEGTMTASVKQAKEKKAATAEAKAKAVGKTIKKKEPAGRMVYSIVKSKRPEPREGSHPELILKTLDKLGGSATCADITAAVVKSGKLVTKMDPLKAVAFWLTTWKRDGKLTAK